MMSFYPFILYLGIGLAAFFLIERLARRKWNIPNTRKSGFQGLNAIHTWGLRIGWTLCCVHVVFGHSPLINTMIILVLWIFDAYMQWRYNRTQKEYIITLMGVVFFVAFISVGYTFDWLL